MTLKNTSQPSTGKPRTVETYDFRRPSALAREHTRVLEMAFETFARQWATSLTSRLRVLCQVTAEKVEMTSYDEYVASLPETTTMVLCDVNGSHATAVLQVPNGTGELCLDYMLGGPGLDPTGSRREFTELEWGLLSQLIDPALVALGDAMRTITTVTVRQSSVAYNPQFAVAAAASEQVVVARLTVHIGTYASHASVMIPADVLLTPLRDPSRTAQTNAADLAARAAAADKLARQIEQVPVQVAVKFHPKTLTAARIDHLAPGELIVLEHRVTEPLTVAVDNTELYKATLGQQGSRRAVTITKKEDH